MTPEEHVTRAINELKMAAGILATNHKEDGYTSKARPLRFVENALLALSQAYPK